LATLTLPEVSSKKFYFGHREQSLYPAPADSSAASGGKVKICIHDVATPAHNMVSDPDV
jgi:hypothetical protein